MPFPTVPFIAPGLLGSLGGAGTAGAAGLGAAGGMAGFEEIAKLLGPKWWQYLIGPGSAVLMDLFESIFGSEEKRERERLRGEIQDYMPMIKPRYPMGDYQIQPGLLHGMNEATIGAVLPYVAKMLNFGMPGGMQQPTDVFDALLAQLPGLSAAPIAPTRKPVGPYNPGYLPRGRV